MYSLSCSSIPPLLTAVITLFVSLYVFFKNPRSKTHRALLYLCLNLAAWAFCSGAAFASSSIDSAERWARLAFVGFAVIPSTSFYFYSVISGIKSRTWSAVFCLLSAAFILLQTTSSLIYREVGLFSWGYYPQAGPRSRAELEQEERLVLAPYAQFSADGGTYDVCLTLAEIQHLHTSTDVRSFSPSVLKLALAPKETRNGVA
jgi:cell division protein FtsW (lipid II flippase)